MPERAIPEADRYEQSLPPRPPDEAEVLEEVDQIVGQDEPVNEADALEQRMPRGY
jgi:hypothetical protein